MPPLKSIFSKIASSLKKTAPTVKARVKDGISNAGKQAKETINNVKSGNNFGETMNKWSQDHKFSGGAFNAMKHTWNAMSGGGAMKAMAARGAVGAMAGGYVGGDWQSAVAGGMMGAATVPGFGVAKGLNKFSKFRKGKYLSGSNIGKIGAAGGVAAGSAVYGMHKAAVTQAEKNTMHLNTRQQGMRSNNLSTDGLTLALSKARHR